MASNTPTRGGSNRGGGGGGGGREGPEDGWECAVRLQQQQASSKYHLEVGSSAGDIGPVMALESPVRPNQSIRTQGLSLNLFMTNQSVEDSSIDVPSSYMCVGDDSGDGRAVAQGCMIPPNKITPPSTTFTTIPYRSGATIRPSPPGPRAHERGWTSRPAADT